MAQIRARRANRAKRAEGPANADGRAGAEASADGVAGRRERRRAKRNELRQAVSTKRAVRAARRSEAREAGPAGPERRSSRRRRSPELARQEILEAAERVFIEFQPDQVGLKEVGREAGVSHALITHYFGTYANMIEAVLERRVRALREGILERLRDAAGALARPTELLSILFRALEDPVHLRLTRWLLASERPSAMHAFALREQGLQVVAHQVATALQPMPGRELVEKVELALVTAVAAAYGYAIGKYALMGAIGRQASRELDEQVQKTLGDMLGAYLRGPGA